MNQVQYSYEEQRMLSEYQQHMSEGRNQSPEQMLQQYIKKITDAQSKIKIIILTLLFPWFLTLLTSLFCVLEPQMAGVESSKLACHTFAIILFIRIKQELNDAKWEILTVPKEQLKLLYLSFDKNVYEFLEEFKFQEKFDILNVLVYGSQIWSFFFSQLLFILPVTRTDIYIILLISYVLHMSLTFSGCIFSCFRQNPTECSCTVLKSKRGYQFINLPKLQVTKTRTQMITIIIMNYYVAKFILFVCRMPSAEKETHIVILTNIIYCSLMILRQIYQLILVNMIKKVNSKHLICFQNAYMLYFKLFFYDSTFNTLWKLVFFFTSVACVLTCGMFNARNYFIYLEDSIYKIEIYIINDTICFVISIMIYTYYMMKKYTIKISLNHIDNQNDQFNLIFYSLDQIVMNPHYRVLYEHLEIEQKQEEERNHREIVRKLQLTPDKSFELMENSECVICTEKLYLDQHLIGLKCHPSHIFHKECLVKWVLLHTTCPTCRCSIQ